MEGSEIDMDYDVGTTNPKTSIVEEELTTNKCSQEDKQFLDRTMVLKIGV